MWLILIPMLAQVPVDRAVLEAEHAREAGASALVAATTKPDARTQRLAARALGRLENTAHASALTPLLSSPDASVRRAAASALAQMRAPYAYAPLLQSERDATVRAVINEAIGRAQPAGDDAEPLLAAGLSNAAPTARAGAARGLESLFRLNPAPRQPTAATQTALHVAFAADQGEEIRELILLTMNAAGDRDSTTIELGLKDASPQVRRLAVIGARRWVSDTSALVRYQALRVARSCEKAAAAVTDPSEHVALAGVELLGSLKCDAALVAPLVTSGKDWRIRGTALVALASLDAVQAQRHLAAMAKEPVWQLRANVATAARTVKDSALLAVLAKDSNPNVAATALTTVDDAMRALRSDHSGLILAGAERLKTAPDLATRLPQLMRTFTRLTADGSMTMRDPRAAVLTRIGEVPDTSSNALLRDALSDRDPAIASLAAVILTARTGGTVAPQTTRLPIPPIPPASYIRALTGATARITMKGLGVITVALLPDEAPVTVGVFAQLAEAGGYDGLTFHRIVPNFVIQGGSPGADEFDGRSREFLRDEVGLIRNARGTIGISTRGRDTGDAQIYFNLVDNFRLDHDYTVMATMTSGMDIMDRVQEGDVIEHIQIIRAPAPSKSPKR